MTRGAVRPVGPDLPGLTFRSAHPDDWDAMADILNRTRRADGIEEIRTGASLASEFVEGEVFEMQRDVLLAEASGCPVGYAIGYRVLRDGVLIGETQGGVVPEFRRRGIGTALHLATRARLEAEYATDPRPGPRELRAYALDLETADRALLRAQGYVPVRYGFEMRRFLTGTLPVHPLPAGLELRAVAMHHHRTIFDADNEAFEDHWGHRAPEEADFIARFQAPDVDPSLWCVAWDGDRVAGVVMNAIYPEENEALGVQRGWLEHVSVRRPWRGRGLAKALCAASLQVLHDQGLGEAWLSVDGSNPTGALRLYEGLGFLVTRRWQAYGRPLERPAPAGWTPGSARTANVEDGPGPGIAQPA